MATQLQAARDRRAGNEKLSPTAWVKKYKWLLIAGAAVALLIWWKTRSKATPKKPARQVKARRTTPRTSQVGRPPGG